MFIYLASPNYYTIFIHEYIKIIKQGDHYNLTNYSGSLVMDENDQHILCDMHILSFSNAKRPQVGKKKLSISVCFYGCLILR